MGTERAAHCKADHNTPPSTSRTLSQIILPALSGAYFPGNEGGDSIYVMNQIKDSSSSDEKWLESIALKEAMKCLTDRERKIIRLRYFSNKTQMEIAEEIGISQAQVSRLEKGALERIRKQI